MYKLYFLPLLLLMLACSPQYKQMRQTQKYSKQNAKRQHAKGSNEVVMGASGELTKDDVNYKDLAKIKKQCLHVNKRGKRCNHRCWGKNKYCFWHNWGSKY